MVSNVQVKEVIIAYYILMENGKATSDVYILFFPFKNVYFIPALALVEE